MEYLPAPLQRALQGGIDPYSQYLAEWYSQVYLCLLVLVSFGASFATSSVLVGLELFGIGFALLMLACVPPWPYLNKHRIKFLTVRAYAVPEKS
ncbi:hypothetical protein CcaverHIS002_0203100 [Cutaneotrichosporon cavernicola]|uniref:Signal peptidase complex subunit 1 n=1 Tax=Cutaneotrichosporon cavernicola TaxID=279322 RepID=A0AA48IF68_9TREE|nr:uncharacterized protein CcaverHIS019_0203100 [Cutaneotrichosporon cavernicola]BEI81150.1 hypothetical protein CcaverHIS002_0203100 [Cutaneotrichosporon cavernicola]BEI88948.1 hypothetical protein CcaverHIS019_0203100 [Cutaneotrichosporon cavernicola]BEI96725.1 hypothetical protein CcaverHIS631_0203140 [Cutaneotrichosporon cavernicola]BEJ04497.1 hypothetical protein CcaverHIS641_0203140 [Cutaneotrichosporon cavernicola]